jgi:hypothetical protein
MNHELLLTDIKRVLHSDMKAGKKLREIESLIERWTAADFYRKL